MIKSLQSLRFVFIMLVVMSHIIGRSFDFGGECGVSFFFVLSGFVLSYAYGGKVSRGEFGCLDFLVKQLLKFYPLHLLTFCVMVMLDWRLGTLPDVSRLLPSIFLLQSLIPNDDYHFVANGSSWFLSALFLLYLVFPRLFLFLNGLSKKGLSVAVATAVIAYAGVVMLIPPTLVNAVVYASPLFRVLDFAWGILLCRLVMSSWGERIGWQLNREMGGVASLLGMAAIGCVVLSFYVYELSAPAFRCAALFWAVTPPVIAIFVITDRWGGVVNRCLHHPLMMWLGTMSLEIYLVHWIVMRLFYSALLRCGISEEMRLHPVMVLVTITVIIGVSYCVKRWFVDKVYAALKHI